MALGVSERTLHEWTRAGAVPHIRRGGVVMYPVGPLRKWLAAQAMATNLERAGADATKSAGDCGRFATVKD